jgi:hypothetical protein
MTGNATAKTRRHREPPGRRFSPAECRGRMLASGMITAADVREVAMALPRTEEHLIRDYVKFRVGKIVYASVSPDELTIGFGFPKEERAGVIASQPDLFLLPKLSDQRFHWINARMTVLGKDEMRELIIDAWRMVVPKKVAAAHLVHLAS